MISSSVESPRNFIEKNIPLNADQTQVFGRSVLPYLYNAFRQWRVFVYTSGNPEVKKHVVPKDLNLSKAIDKWSQYFVRLANHPNSVDFHLFKTNIEGCSLPVNKTQTNEAIRLWLAMMLRQITWNANIPEQPYIVDLSDYSPLTVSLLPKVLIFDDFRLLRLMDSFYAPDKKGAEWAEKLFDYIADKYESIIDLELKERIDRILLLNCQGNVLDFGCGTGLLQAWLKKWGTTENIRLFGIDISGKMLEKAKKRGEIVIKGNIPELAPDNIREGFRQQGSDIAQFDNAIMSYVDNWTTHDERIRIFRNAYELLRVGGRLRLNVYDISKNDWDQYYRRLFQEVGFRKSYGLERRLEARDGFRDVGFTYAEK